ncbi:MAG: pre-16S rRNA-processing nuclease YqgF [Armatimonadota bacterium]|nr:pre-16S rRNA-processing nuclease YqgF [Armatimonadota bacterium]
MELLVLAVDPGRSKCGLAVVGSDSGVRTRAVVPRTKLVETVETFARAYSPSVVIVGGGTGSKAARSAIEAASGGAPVETVDEKFTSLDAKERFFKENPPRGFRKLIPVTLQSPQVPYDDYVAVLLAERYIATHSESAEDGQPGADN